MSGSIDVNAEMDEEEYEIAEEVAEENEEAFAAE